MNEIEESNILKIDFNKIKNIGNNNFNVIPAVAQNFETKEILIIGYVNEEAILKAREINKVVFFSTSRNELWIKGATSGDFLELIDILINCEQNSIVYLCNPVGRDLGSCHTKNLNKINRRSCFYRRINKENQLEFLS